MLLVLEVGDARAGLVVEGVVLEDLSSLPEVLYDALVVARELLRHSDHVQSHQPTLSRQVPQSSSRNFAMSK